MNHRYLRQAILVMAAVVVTAAFSPVVHAEVTAWIIEFKALPFALRGEVRAVEKPRHAMQTIAGQAVLQDIERSLATGLININETLGRNVVVTQSYRLATVGFAVNMSRSEAKVVENMADVLRVSPDHIAPVPSHESAIPLNVLPLAQHHGGDAVDPVAELTGATRVWDGSATGDDGHLGGGVIVAVTGTGINSRHPSFAAMGDDGFVHSNPLGDGVYLGECFATPDLPCNSKLIGRYNLTGDSDVSSEDEEGYSTFMTGLVAGNRLSGDTIAATGLGIVTGIAPHANIIAYQACVNFGCPTSVSIQAFEQAIADGVDVLLHLIGSSFVSPWQSPQSYAALAMHQAGVSVVVSVGANGPGPGTIGVSLAAPWTSSISTSTHAYDWAAKELKEFSGGDMPPPPTLPGRSLSPAYSGAIVYAGNLSNPNSPGADPAQCLEPFPAGTLNGEILVCDRGEIARVQKAINAVDSGAGGFVLANIAGGPDNVAADFYAVPGIHINLANADLLRTWLGTGVGHTASIGFADAFDPDLADRLTPSSSRGPFMQLSYLVPSMTAPAVDVVAASIDPNEFELRSVRGSAPGAGALALLKSVHPDWTLTERQSALMTTAVAPLHEYDMATLTGPFDHGGGRINVAAAARAALVLDVPHDDFLAANPALGGRPQTLNLAGLVDLECVGGCEWTRRVRATHAGNWTASSTIDNSGVQVVVEPASFSLAVNEQQAITISVTGSANLPDNNYVGNVVLTTDDTSIPATTLALAIGYLSDADNDGIASAFDNCSEVPNPDQRDTNNDGYGNICDPDLNDDGVTNFLDVRQFGAQFGSDAEDADFDGSGIVDALDLSILQDFFLLPPGPSGLQ